MFSLEYLDCLRSSEIEVIINRLPAGDIRILEIGAGTGRQAAEIRKRGFEVEAIEIPDSNYKEERVFPIMDYDGVTIPFPDASFDVVFSSNVLEHVRDLEKMHAEIRRVLKPGGYCLHILPTHAWRIWTTLASIPDGFLRVAAMGTQLRNPKSWPKALWRMGSFVWQRRHGERGNPFTEVFYFHPSWWRRNFRENGFTLNHDAPVGLFYTGHMVGGSALSIANRQALSHYLGSACHLYDLSIGRTAA